jgi:hypothetical protein
MWIAEGTAETTASPAQVWELWEDPTRWDDWNPGINSGELEGPFAVGSVAIIDPKGFTKLRFRFVEIDPGRLLVSEARLPGGRLRHDHLVEKDDGCGARILNRLTISGPLGWAWALAFGRRLRREVKDYARLEKELAEAV